MKQTVIFLDIDGVLRPFRPYRRVRTQKENIHIMLQKKYGDHRYQKLDEGILKNVYFDWSKEAIAALHTVLKETNAVIVLSSSWRLFYSLSEMKLLLHLHDLDAFLSDKTENLGNRAEEIKQYLKQHREIKHYLVLDDIPMEHEFPNHALTTKEYFKKDQITKALAILDKPVSNITKV